MPLLPTWVNPFKLFNLLKLHKIILAWKRVIIYKSGWDGKQMMDFKQAV